MADDFSNNEEKTSKYNSGIAQLMRLDELWKDTHRHSRAGKLNNWNWDLDRIWCELAADLTDKDPKIDEYNSFVAAIGDLNKKLGMKEINAVEYQKQLYLLLMEKELSLRRLQNKLGKGTALRRVDEDEIE